MNNNIPQQVLQGLKDLSVETGKEAIKQGGEITKGIITAEAWLGDITKMTDEELQKSKQDEEKKKQEEMARIRQSMTRNVESELSELRHEEKQEEQREKQQEEKQKEEEERQLEIQQQQTPIEVHGKKGRGNPNAGKQKPKKEDMSETQEFAKKKD